MTSSVGHPPAVALIHGFPDGPESWAHCSQIIRDAGRSVYQPSLPGYRRTPGAPTLQEHTPRALGQEIAEQLLLTGDRPRAGMHVVGHDWGGVAAWMMTQVAYEAPSRILSLTIVNAPHPCNLHAHLAAPSSAYARALARATLPEVWLRMKRYDPMLAPLREAGMPEPMLERLRAHCGIRDNLRGMLAPYRALATLGPVPTFAASVPTLLLHGENDAYVSASHMLPAPESRGDLRVEALVGVGHWPQLQAPRVLADRLLSFWSSVELG